MLAILAGVIGATAQAQDGPDSFQIVTPEIEIMPGEEITYCYYFRTPNTRTAAVSRWDSEMGTPTVGVRMFLTTDSSFQPVDKMPPGTVSAANCGLGSNPAPHWVYAADTPLAEVALPADDGNGRPVAQEIPPNSAGFIQIHNLNGTASPLATQVTITAHALDRRVQYTASGTYVTYNASINIPVGAIGDVESKTCPVPTGAQFWRMTTHAHKQAVRTAVLDNLDVVFESTDWQHPGAQEWPAAPFFTFASNALTYACTYNNPNSWTIFAGDSAATDEQCMAIGHYFPACLSRYCINNFLLPSSAPCDLILVDGFEGA